MNNEEDIKRKEELIREHKRRLHLLEKRAAVEGITVDPSVMMQIEDVAAIIKLLQREVEDLRRASHKDTPTSDISSDIIDVLGIATVNQNAALITLAVKIEQRLALIANLDTTKDSRRGYVSPIRIVEEAVKNGVFDKEFLESVRYFWHTRNRTAHAIADNGEVTLRELYIGVRILQTIASK